MSSTNRYVTVVAIVLLVLTLPLTWQIATVRADQVTEHERSDLVQEQVATRQGPTDYDGDSIDDGSDRCPTRPETTNGFQDDDGCPDIVATTGAS